jgi:putative endonuclease
MPFSVYIIYSELFNQYYIGQTNDIITRLSRHNAGYVKSTSAYCPWILKLTIDKDTREEAMALEKKLKNLNRIKLLRFIEKYC